MTPVGPRAWRPLTVLALGPLVFATLTASAFADTSDDGASNDAPPVSLRLSPAVLEVPTEPGAAEHDLRVDNLGGEPLDVVAELSEFTVTEDGTTEFSGPDELAATSWVELDADEFTIAPGDQRDVTLTVDVPDDAEPGERYVSVIFAVPGDPDGDGNITVTHRVAAKLYIEVPGEQIERLELGDLSGPQLIDSASATFELPVHNRGNVHRTFQEDGRLTATAGDADFPFQNFTVLGDSTRVVEAVWPNPPMLCWCTVDVEVPDGQGNLLTASARVIAFPLRLTLALLALSAGLVVLTVARRRRRAARLEQQLAQARDEGAATFRDAHPQPAATASPAAQSPAAPTPATTEPAPTRGRTTVPAPPPPATPAQ